MKKKRKITKNSLDKIAKELSVIPEDLCCNYIGGASYYDFSGNYLGSIGPGDEMRVISTSEFENAKRNYENLGGVARFINENCTLASHQLYGIALSSAPQKTKEEVISRFLPEPLKMRLKGWLTGERNGIQAGFAPDGSFYLNADGFILDSESSIKSTFEHELSHLKNEDYSGNVMGLSWETEKQAFFDQINSPTYITTSYEYRRFVAEILVKLGGYSESDAYAMAKVYV